MSADERVFWRSDTSCLWVGYDDNGRLVFRGQDRVHLDGNEYWIKVAHEQFDAVRVALGAGLTVDVVDLVCAPVADIMSQGERTWLDEHGVTYEFSSY